MPASAIRMPAAAGPVAKASAWFVDAIVATRGNASRPTRLGRNAMRAGLSNAVAQAAATTIPYSRPRLTVPRAVATQRIAPQVSDTDWASIMMRRRSVVSASAPAISDRAKAGRNCTRPISPRWNGERVSWKTCQAIAARSIIIAVPAANRLAR